jgi:acetyltransferase
VDKNIKNLKEMLAPKTIAVVGASAKVGSVGNDILKNLVDTKFVGSVYPISLKETEICGLKCYKSVADVRGAIDMAVVVVPAAIVNGVIEECGKKKVKAAIIISAGFKEIGGAGVEIEKQVMATAAKYGITILGPNCLGAINTSKTVNMNASFAPAKAIVGDVGFASQSGALVAGILNILPTLNVGVSQMVSLGNQTDVAASDFMKYWNTCDEVKQALFYLEGVKNPKEFKLQATALSVKKPIIVVKSGRSSEGSKAAASHTGSLAGGDRAVGALFDSCGVIRETSLKDMFNTALVFSKCGIPNGNRVGIVTNSGGPGVLSTDLLVEHGMEMAPLSGDTQTKLRGCLMPQAAVGNPVDVIASASVEQYKSAIELTLKDPNVDMLLCIYLYVSGRNDIAVLKLLNEYKKKFPNKPIVSVFMTASDFPDLIKTEIPDNSIAYFAHVEEAVYGMKRLYERATYLKNINGKVPTLTVNKAAAQAIIKGAEKRFGNGINRTLTTFESLEIFKSYGLPVPPYAIIKGEGDLKANEKRVGYPAVLKISSYETSHKSDVGGVVLNIQSYEQLVAEYKRISAIGGAGDGVVLMQQVKGSREFVAGVSTYEDLHMLMFGIGGIFIEVLNEVKFVVLPLNNHSSKQLLNSQKIKKLLGEVRGMGATDEKKVNDLFYRIDKLVADFDNIDELDINPIMIDKAGNLFAVDARIALKK